MSKIKVVHYINQFFAQIGGEEPVIHPQLILLDPLVQCLDVHTAVPQVGQRLHDQAVARGSTQRIHNVDLAVRKLLTGDQRGAGGRVIGAGQAGGKTNMQNIPSAFQNGGKQLQILGDIHL